LEYAIENYLKFFKAVYDIPYVIVRYCAVFGPRQSVWAVPGYIRKLAQGKQAKIWGDGRKTRDYVFIKEPAPLYYPDRPGEQIRFALDNSKAKEYL